MCVQYSGGDGQVMGESEWPAEARAPGFGLIINLRVLSDGDYLHWDARSIIYLAYRLACQL